MKRVPIIAIVLLCIVLGSAVLAPAVGAETVGRTVLATTFPMYQLTRNVTQGREGMRVELMLPAQQGCPHDYALTPQDMQKLAKADILVVNGLGMEEFLGAPVQTANPTLRVIDSSAGIEETLAYAEDHPHHHEPGHDHDTEHADHGPEADHHEHGEDHDAAHHDHGHGHHHAHAGKNPHLFASPRMSARLALNIAAELSKADPDGAALYFKNARVYAETMNRLADDLAALGKRLKNNRIVEPHGVFDYLARDMGLEIVAVMLAHGQEPSASEMMRIVKSIKEKRAGAIFTEPQYPEKIGKTLSKETGIPVAMIDPVATGPENAPLTYYETVMRQNMGTFASTMGVK